MSVKRYFAAYALIIIMAVNLRPAVTSVGPLLTEIRGDFGLSGTAAGALTTLPVMCFGAFGLIAPAVRGRLRDETLLVLAMGLLIVGLVVRVGPWSPALFGGSLLAGLAISIGNVCMPAVIKRDRPEAVTLATAIYTVGLNVGAAASSGLVVPVEHAASSGWRFPLLLLVVPAAVAIVAWLPRVRRGGGTASGGGPRARLWRDPLAWQVTGFMGVQSLMAYVTLGWLPTLVGDRGMSPTAAGFVLSLSAVVQMVGALTLPSLARRLRDQRPLVVGVVVLTAAGFAGVTWAPLWSVWGWAAVLGLGQGLGFALALAFIGLRSADAHVAGGLSGMAQGVGYLIAALGPLGVGILHDLTGGWSVPIVIMLLLCAVLAVPGLGAGRARTVGHRAEPAPADARRR